MHSCSTPFLNFLLQTSIYKRKKLLAAFTDKIHTLLKKYIRRTSQKKVFNQMEGGLREEDKKRRWKKKRLNIELSFFLYTCVLSNKGEKMIGNNISFERIDKIFFSSLFNRRYYNKYDDLLIVCFRNNPAHSICILMK